jgi:hypothetical protein
MFKKLTAVTKSNLTLSLLKDISETKIIIKKIEVQNKSLKKLCYFNGDIEAEAKRKLVENSKLLTDHNTVIKVCKNDFVKSYEVDFINSQNGTTPLVIEDKKTSTVETNYLFKIPDFMFTPREFKLLNILEHSLLNNIHLGHYVTKTIEKEFKLFLNF